MSGHRMVDVENRVSVSPHTSAKLWLLSRDQPLVKAVCFQQDLPADQNVAATEFGEPRPIHPVEIKNAIEDRSLRIDLAPMPPHGGDRRIPRQCVAGCAGKIPVKHSISIEKEDQMGF